MDMIITLITVNLMIITLFTVSYFINRISNNGIFFGIRFPLEYLNQDEIIALEKSYRKIIIAVHGALFTLVNGIMLKHYGRSGSISEVIVVAVIFVTIFISNGSFIIYYFKTKKLKAEKGWTYKRRNVVVTDTTLRKPKKDEKYKTIASKLFLLLLVIPVAMSLLTLAMLESLPAVMEIPNSIFGIIATNTLKGKLIIFQLPITQFIIGFTMYGMNMMINKSRVDLNSGTIETTVPRKKKIKRLGSILIFVIDIQIMAMFSIIQGSILFSYDITIINYIFMAIMFLTMGIILFMFIKIGQDSKVQEKSEKDELYKDDDDKWVLGGFYYNKNDPAWMVEKRTGVGWTLNFANPKSWIATAVLILFIVGNIVFSVMASK